MTVHKASNSHGWSTWRLVCDNCDRSWWTALTRYTTARAAAQARGWVITEIPDVATCRDCSIAPDRLGI